MIGSGSTAARRTEPFDGLFSFKKKEDAEQSRSASSFSSLCVPVMD